MLDLDADAVGTLAAHEPRLEDGVELVDGQPVEKHMGMVSSFVEGRLFSALDRHLQAHPSGWLFGPSAGYRCFPQRPRLVRKPDVSVIRFGRLDNEQLPAGETTIHPDLAVEVVSPNDLYDEVDCKISEYLDVGVRLVWVVNPQSQTVHIYRPDGTVRRLRVADTLDGGDVLAGFSVPVAELFRTPTPPA
jgi:Uma2 family endonuclease